MTQSLDDEDPALLCSSCNAPLGHIDAPTGGHRLDKSALSLSSSPQHPSVSYSRDKWLTLHLLAAVENQGVRRFSLSARDSTLKLWLFTPDLLVSSSALPCAAPLRVAKILWRRENTLAATASSTLESEAPAEAELSLTRHAAGELARSLERSAHWLPLAARSFHGWRVGLLERFAGGHAGQ